MKKRINLISPEAISASGAHIKFPLLRGPLLLKVAAIALVVFASVTVYQQANLNIYQWKLAQAKKIYANSQTELKQNKNIMARLNIERDNFIRSRKKLEDRIAVLSIITKPEVETSAILASLAELVSDKLWINKISLDKNRLKLVGKALDNTVVSDFMVRLDKSPNFKNTSFVYTEKKKLGEQEVVEFEIISQLEKAIYPED